MRRQRGLRSPRRSGPHGALEIFRPVRTHSDGESWNRFPLWPDSPCFAGHLCQRASERRCSEAKDAAGLVRGVVLGIMKPRSHIPLATYRLQLNRDFTFAQATAIVPYLSALVRNGVRVSGAGISVPNRRCEELDEAPGGGFARPSDRGRQILKSGPRQLPVIDWSRLRG